MPASSIVQITLGANAEQQVLGPNDRRRSILFTTSSTSVVYLRNDSQGAAIGGVAMVLTGGPVVMDRETYGDIVCKPWFALAGVLCQVGIVETIN